MSKGKVLVTGATGHIGSFVVKRLLEQDYNVRVFVLPHEKESLPGLQNFRKDIEVSVGNVCYLEDLISAFSDTTAGIHMAAKIGIYGYPKEIKQMQDINYGGTINFHKAALKHNIENTICFGSIEALKDPSNWKPEYSPDNVFEAISPYTPYGRIKATTIKEVIKLYPNTKIILPPGIIGPNDHVPSEIGKEIRKAAFSNIPSFSVGGKFMWAHPDDVARAAVFALQKGKRGEYYFVDGFENNLSEIFLEVKKNSNNSFIRSLIINIPIKLAWNIALVNYKIGKIIDRPTHIRLTPLSISILKNYKGISFELIEKSRRDLGYTPQHNLKDTIRETIEYFQRNS